MICKNSNTPARESRGVVFSRVSAAVSLYQDHREGLWFVFNATAERGGCSNRPFGGTGGASVDV